MEADVQTVERTSKLLILYPQDSFSEISDSAAWWLNQYSKSLSDQLFWPLWDRIAGVILNENEDTDHG